MDGKKVYSIQINGVQESIDAVLALNKMLNELENRIQALEKKNIKINTGGSSSSKGTSALSEEAKLEKQIAAIDAKREAYSKEIYQNYLAAKDVLDKTVKDQKQIAAQERLQAKNYTNTMAGMKQELADLKTVINTTDLGDEEFQKLTQRAGELTAKLKELEAQYGQFGRDVGNYDRVGQTMSKITVNVGGVVREFDNLKQATKAVRDEMGKLEVNGQKDTKTYKQLEREASRLAKAQLRLNSAMNDAKASSKAMDDLLDAMEGFTALGQVGQGFSTLFGFDSSALEQQIAKLVALQNVLSGIEKIRQQMNTQEGLGKLFAKGSDAVDNFVMKITGAQKRMGMLVKDTRAASLAVQGLSKALKFVGGSIATLGLSVLLETLTKTIGKLKEWAFGSMDAAEATEVASSNFDVLNRRIKEFNRLNEKQVFDGIMTSEEALANKTKYLTVQLTTLLNAFKNLRQYSDEDWFSKGGIVGGLSKAQERFEDLQVDIINLDQQAKKSLLPDWIVKLTNGGYRAEKQFEKVGRALAIDFLGRTKKALNAFEQAKAEAEKELQEMGEVNPETQKKLDILKTEIAGIRHEMNNGQVYGTIFDNIEKFAKDSPFLVRAINNTRDAINALDDTINSTNVDSSKLAQLQIDAMKDGLEKQKKQIELNRNKELAEVGDNEELKKAVNAKYRREEIEAEKQFGNQYRAALADLASIRIDLMKEGWEKEKKQLEHERDERIRAIQESEILVGERTAAIRELYRKKIEKAEKEWREQQLENYREYLTEIEMMNREAYAMEVSNSLTNVENRAFEKTDKADKGINESNYRDIDKMKEYYDELLKIELDAAKEEEEIRQEALQNEIDDAKQDEEIRHKRLVNASNGEYAKQLEAGLITKEQYDELIQKENAAHEATMNALDKRFAAESLATTQDGLDKMYNAYNGYYQRLEALIRRKQDKIQNDLDDANRNADRQANKNFGFFNAKELGKQYDEAIKKQKELITKIKGDLEQLEKDNKAGKVIGEAYEQEKENLEASLRAGIQTLENYEDESMKIVDKVVGQINQYFQILGQSVQQVFQAVWDYQDYALDKEQEKLDKWNEQLDKQLDEQEKIVEEHKNNVNSIEDELATARGDRRQHLIDQLNAEISAQRAAQKEEQRIQKEQEAAKKRQEQLDKKRRQEEYERNVTQAFISWHLAIANGLATQPFMPLGIAMGALATVLGAVQYALVKSQKPYAKGGQLDGGVAQGKRHRDGGIPVLGGRASIEGGEFITNRQTTANNVDLLEFVNSKHRKLNIDDFIDFYSSGKAKKNIISMSPRTKFADGGQIPTLDNTYSFDDRLLEAFEKYADRPSVVSVVDINNKQDDVKRVQALAGLDV
jgi:hypothetical protein